MQRPRGRPRRQRPLQVGLEVGPRRQRTVEPLLPRSPSVDGAGRSPVAGSSSSASRANAARCSGVTWPRLLRRGVGDVLRRAQRERADGRRRVHAAGGDEQAAVDDEQVRHVVRAAPRVAHAGGRVGAHPRGAEQVAGLVVADPQRVGRARAAGQVRLACALEVPVELPPVVLGDGVGDARRRDAVAVAQRRVERDAVRLVGQVLGDRRPSRCSGRCGCARAPAARAPQRCRTAGRRAARPCGAAAGVGITCHLAPRTKPRSVSVS